MPKKNCEIRLQLPAGAANPAIHQWGLLLVQRVSILQASVRNSTPRRRIRQGRSSSGDFSVFGSLSIITVATSPVLLKKAAGLAKGASTPGKEQVGTVTHAQVMKSSKQWNLNTNDEEAAARMIIGTAKNMGIKVKG